MDLEERLSLVLRNVAEVVTKEELIKLLEEKRRPTAYIGYEPSGLVHLGWMITVDKIKDFTEAGFEVTVLLADWHAWINNKLGGSLERIQKAAKYMEHCFKALGVDESRTKFVLASDLVDSSEYWEKVVRIAKSATLRRVRRSLPIMGRSALLDDMETAWVIYPCMQVADIFHLGVDVAYAGMDQRKAHMLARDVAEKLGWKKPICVHTPLLMGLKGVTRMNIDEDPDMDIRISSKMSKSKPDTFISVHDPPDEIRRKIRAAYCPPREAEYNPILEIAKYIVFRHKDKLVIERPEKYGGRVEFDSYQSLERAYVRGEIHPLDLKNAVADSLIEILEPVRDYFEKRPDLLQF